jgi:hypothetical protein
MAHFAPHEGNAFLEGTKLSLSTVESDLDSTCALQILPRLQIAYDTSSWTDESTTPTLIRSLIAMLYVASVYDRTYSDNTDPSLSNYARSLRRIVEANITGLLNGTIVLPEQPDVADVLGTPLFFPNDASSQLGKAADCEGGMGTLDDPSNTDASFSMGSVF